MWFAILFLGMAFVEIVMSMVKGAGLAEPRIS